MKLENTDIHKIIDDAMEKKDRAVMIFISDVGTTVNVHPIDDHKPHWIPQYVKNDKFNYEYTASYACSECGAENKYPTCYCGFCGEKMSIIREDENGRD